LKKKNPWLWIKRQYGPPKCRTIWSLQCPEGRRK
jgi:hypothetical protein